MNWSVLIAAAGFVLLLGIAAVLLVVPTRLDDQKIVWKASFWVAGAFCAFGTIVYAITLIIIPGTHEQDVLVGNMPVCIVGILGGATLMFVVVPLRFF